MAKYIFSPKLIFIVYYIQVHLIFILIKLSTQSCWVIVQTQRHEPDRFSMSGKVWFALKYDIRYDICIILCSKLYFRQKIILLMVGKNCSLDLMQIHAYFIHENWNVMHDRFQIWIGILPFNIFFWIFLFVDVMSA